MYTFPSTSQLCTTLISHKIPIKYIYICGKNVTKYETFQGGVNTFARHCIQKHMHNFPLLEQNVCNMYMLKPTLWEELTQRQGCKKWVPFAELTKPLYFSISMAHCSLSFLKNHVTSSNRSTVCVRVLLIHVCVLFCLLVGLVCRFPVFQSSGKSWQVHPVMCLCVWHYQYISMPVCLKLQYRITHYYLKVNTSHLVRPDFSISPSWMDGETTQIHTHKLTHISATQKGHIL